MSELSNSDAAENGSVVETMCKRSDQLINEFVKAARLIGGAEEAPVLLSPSCALKNNLTYTGRGPNVAT
ncbi:unnamed protein product [Toxocara canis]|uniref:Phosphoenolpyruvate carboxylase n=1 Tax=Toxocara canis TaxID=6265 RepID=A0A183V7C9_TOXCA|nr:unnamed protein product [Toxocara canis]